MNISKSLLTNTIAVLIILISFVVPNSIQTPLLYMGLFALSGALTNHIAVHMLFEKVPFLYGSGVIELKFEAFKKAIKVLMMQQFFTREQLNNFFTKEEKKIDLAPLVHEADFSPAFDALSKTVMESQFGNMLGMFGGESALENLRDPFSSKLKSAVTKIVSTETFKTQLEHHLQHSSLSDDLLDSIEKIVERRLDELSPKMVKEMMQDLMREHLGWLVVWGGVFGGFIGLISSFVI
ncbi:MAG: DUF445 domain-containing protein [Epsilonproteobacteria bacterium]|nr:DUF445 domain-containing protein [Campylobacterota bacterium]